MDRQLVKAANSGDVYAMLAMGYIYHRGVDGEYDAAKAIEWYKKSAAKGCARAKWELAKLYNEGTIVEPNSYMYIHWLTTAADSGIPEAMMALARCYYLGFLVPKDEYLFSVLLLKAADQNFVLANFYLWYFYSHGLFFEKDPELAEEYKLKTVVRSDADMLFDMGMMLEFGRDFIRADPAESLEWYSRAAEMGSDKALYCLGRIESTRRSGKQDTLEYRKARIARLSTTAESVERDRLLDDADSCLEDGDFERAVELYKMSADLGNADAMYMLAFLYHEGQVVQQDSDLAMEYLQRSAVNGNADSMMLLAKIYEEGEIRPRDYDEAIRYYSMAAAAGNLVGYYELSRFMEHPEQFVRRTQTVVR